MKVATRVQHHPDRASLLRPLLARLPAGSVVVLDPNPVDGTRSPFRTYVEALRVPVADDVTHLLVVQDDAVPCERFPERMLERLEEKPDDLVAFFAPGAATHRTSVLRAAQKNQTWARLHGGWIPCVALCWPVYRAREFVEHARVRYGDLEKHRADDAPIGYWTMRNRIPVYATVPSLVEHPDIEPSLIGKKNSSGRNRARVAAIFDT